MAKTYIIQLKADADHEAFKKHVKEDLKGSVTHESKLVKGQVHVEIPDDVVTTFDSNDSVETSELDKPVYTQ
jgi:molybdopterin-binding protein